MALALGAEKLGDYVRPWWMWMTPLMTVWASVEGTPPRRVDSAVKHRAGIQCLSCALPAGVVVRVSSRMTSR